jgi:hypothetical protein
MTPTLNLRSPSSPSTGCEIETDSYCCQAHTARADGTSSQSTTLFASRACSLPFQRHHLSRLVLLILAIIGANIGIHESVVEAAERAEAEQITSLGIDESTKHEDNEIFGRTVPLRRKVSITNLQSGFDKRLRSKLGHDAMENGPKNWLLVKRFSHRQSIHRRLTTALERDVVSNDYFALHSAGGGGGDQARSGQTFTGRAPPDFVTNDPPPDFVTAGEETVTTSHFMDTPIPPGFENCTVRLAISDSNDDEMLNRTEYEDYLETLTFGLLQPPFADYPAVFVMLFYAAACTFCVDKTGDPQCCIGNKANVDLSNGTQILAFICTAVEEAAAEYVEEAGGTRSPVQSPDAGVATDSPVTPTPTTSSPSDQPTPLPTSTPVQPTVSPVQPTKSPIEAPTLSPVEPDTPSPVVPDTPSPTAQPTPAGEAGSLLCVQYAYRLTNELNLTASDILNGTDNSILEVLVSSTNQILQEIVDENFGNGEANTTTPQSGSLTNLSSIPAFSPSDAFTNLSSIPAFSPTDAATNLSSIPAFSSTDAFAAEDGLFIPDVHWTSFGQGVPDESRLTEDSTSSSLKRAAATNTTPSGLVRVFSNPKLDDAVHLAVADLIGSNASSQKQQEYLKYFDSIRRVVITTDLSNVSAFDGPRFYFQLNLPDDYDGPLTNQSGFERGSNNGRNLASMRSSSADFQLRRRHLDDPRADDERLGESRSHQSGHSGIGLKNLEKGVSSQELSHSLPRLPRTRRRRKLVSLPVESEPTTIISVTSDPFCTKITPSTQCALVSAESCVLLGKNDDPDVVRPIVVSGLADAINDGALQDAIDESLK